jgi:hypothetical protein
MRTDIEDVNREITDQPIPNAFSVNQAQDNNGGNFFTITLRQDIMSSPPSATRVLTVEAG